MATLRTGELARRAQVNVETLRFYERKGLLPVPPRRASGYREYPQETVDRIRFIQRARQLGFTLREIKELLALREESAATCGDVVERARRKVEEIDTKIHDLQAMRSSLTRLLERCSGTAPIVRCPIIESLAGPATPEPEGAPPARMGKGNDDEECCGPQSRGSEVP